MILLQRFVQICLFRAGPAEVPASLWLLKLVLFFYFVVGAMVSHIDYEWQISLVASVSDMAVMLAGCWLLLYIRGVTGRYVQTITAMAGAGTVLGVLSLPILWLFRQVEAHSQLTSLVLLLVMVMIFWSLLVTAHIFRNAMEIGAGMAAVVTVIYTFFSLLLVGLAMSGAV